MVVSDRPLDLVDLAGAAAAVTPVLPLRTDSSERFLLLVDDDGLPLVWIAPSRPVQDPPAARARLLSTHAGGAAPGGTSAATSTEWWTEVVVPMPRGRVDPLRGDVLQRWFEELARRCGATVVSLSTPVPGSGGWPLDPPPLGADDDPSDLSTGSSALLLQSRAVVGLSPWLMGCLLWARDHARECVLVTSPAVRVTPAVEGLVARGALRWVCDDGRQAHDCRTGRTVTWDGERFREGDAVAAPVPPADLAWQVVVEVEAFHPYRDDLVLGGLVESAVRALDLPLPRAQGLLEPPEGPWDPGILTRFARTESPVAASTIVSGEGYDATLTVRPEPVGVTEQVELHLVGGPRPHTAEELVRIGSRLLAGGCQRVVLGHRLGTASRLGTTTPAGPLLPGLVAVRAERVPGLEDEVVRAVAPAAVQVGGEAPGWVVPLVPAVEAEPSTRAELLRQWQDLPLLLQRHDGVLRAARGS